MIANFTAEHSLAAAVTATARCVCRRRGWRGSLHQRPPGHRSFGYPAARRRRGSNFRFLTAVNGPRARPRAEFATRSVTKNAEIQRPNRATNRRRHMAYDKAAVRQILDRVRADKRTALTAPEGKLVCDAYGIPVPQEFVAQSAAEAGQLAQRIGGLV